jgi:hypothetical protein
MHSGACTNAERVGAGLAKVEIKAAATTARIKGMPMGSFFA